MQLQCMIQDGTAWISSGDNTVEITPAILNAARRA
jgi:uncharacterized protein YaeQ